MKYGIFSVNVKQRIGFHLFLLRYSVTIIGLSIPSVELLDVGVLKIADFSEMSKMTCYGYPLSFQQRYRGCQLKC